LKYARSTTPLCKIKLATPLEKFVNLFVIQKILEINDNNKTGNGILVF